MKKMITIVAVMFSLMAHAVSEQIDGLAWTYYVKEGAAIVGMNIKNLVSRYEQSVSAIPVETSGKVTIPSSLGGYPVKTIGDSAFYNCRELTGIEITGDVTSIELLSFAYCTKLEKLTIPEGVRDIGDSAFAGCRGLTHVSIPSSVTNIGEMAFNGCSGLSSIDVANGNSFYKSVNGLLLSKDGKVLFAGVNGDVKIPEGVMVIGPDAFSCRSKLLNVTIPQGVLYILNDAFIECVNLISVTIPSSISSIGALAFSCCDSLRTIYVDKGDTKRVKRLLEASSVNVSQVTFVEGDVSSSDQTDFEKAMTFNGLVKDTNGAVYGLTQIVTAKATRKGVKVSGFVMLEDGKKQTVKAVTVPIENGQLNVSTKVGKTDLTLTITDNGFTGTLGEMSVASGDVGEDTGIISGTLKMSYFDAKTGKIKTKSIKLTGIASDGEAIGDLTIKGQATKSFAAEIQE